MSDKTYQKTLDETDFVPTHLKGILLTIILY
ncbi:hypothetical protein SAMN06265350_103136 [Solitalea koreensis]|uniref:Uncharacterized protein n=1 Tax=Solitalea koreensis TaxID=543615 RepID=A0A521C1X0_9SPHI|nr:hypothetical protein SAMN06265350_103136 [Solitalea koreensis]